MHASDIPSVDSPGACTALGSANQRTHTHRQTDTHTDTHTPSQTYTHHVVNVKSSQGCVSGGDHERAFYGDIKSQANRVNGRPFITLVYSTAGENTTLVRSHCVLIAILRFSLCLTHIHLLKHTHTHTHTVFTHTHCFSDTHTHIHPHTHCFSDTHTHIHPHKIGRVHV